MRHATESDLDTMNPRQDMASSNGNDGSLDELTLALTRITRAIRSPKMSLMIGGRTELDVRPDLFTVLARVCDLQPVRVTELAGHLGFERTTVSRQINELEALGCVARQPSPDDGRAVLLKATRKGLRVNAEVFRVWRELLAEVLGAFPPAQQARLVPLMAAFGQALENALESR